MEALLHVLTSTTEGNSPVAPETKKPDKKMNRVTEEEKARTCSKCGKVLATRQALRNHLNKVFLCDRKGERRFKKKILKTSHIHCCRKCGKTFSSAAGLRCHATKLNLCKARQSAGQLVRKNDSQPKTLVKCHKCHASFACSQNLRLHLSRLNPCDNSTPKQHDHGDKTCSKCNTTFTSAQSLRLHLTRLIPCDAEQPPELETGTTKPEHCPKCHKKFASERGLRIHMGQRSCDHEPSSQHSYKKPNKTRGLSRPNKAPPVKGFLNEYLSTVAQRGKTSSPQFKEEQRQILQKWLETRSVVADGSNSKVNAEIAVSSSLSIKRKRNVEDNREEMSPVGEANKRVRSETGSFAELVANISRSSSLPATPQGKNPKSGDTKQKRKTNHGGNILTDGCCCRQCVRVWTRKMMNRLNYLTDEVTSLRRLVHGGQNSTTEDLTSQPFTMKSSADTNPKEKRETESYIMSLDPADSTPRCYDKEHLNQNAVAKTKADPQTSCKSTSACISGTANACDVNHHGQNTSSAKDPVKLMLTEKYNHLNDQIITNERALEDSVAYLKEISQHGETSSLELRTQLDELRVYIDVEKGKRDEAVAAVIAQRWNARGTEFRVLLENTAVKSRPNAEKAFHEECAEIASQLEEKNKMLSKLSGLIGTVGLSGEISSKKNGCEIPKFVVEKTAKNFLERQRDDIFMCLLRSSPRIYLITKEKLVEVKK